LGDIRREGQAPRDICEHSCAQIQGGLTRCHARKNPATPSAIQRSSFQPQFAKCVGEFFSTATTLQVAPPYFRTILTASSTMQMLVSLTETVPVQQNGSMLRFHLMMRPCFRTSLDHQPERAPKSSAIHKLPAQYPHLSGPPDNMQREHEANAASDRLKRGRAFLSKGRQG